MPISSAGSLLLFWVVLLQFAGIYLFTGGFLLSRLSLSDTTTCTSGCQLEPTHSRAIVLIIDALRFDFVSPHPPHPLSPFHHDVLTLPKRLTAENPRNSFLFDTYSDPPTATLQRIKALTTGSLPTFVDIGNNFGASSIAEDSIIKQLQAAGKKVSSNTCRFRVIQVITRRLHLWETIRGFLYSPTLFIPTCPSLMTHSTSKTFTRSTRV